MTASAIRLIHPAELHNLYESIDLLERENQHLREIISDMLDRHAAEFARERERCCIRVDARGEHCGH